MNNQNLIIAAVVALIVGGVGGFIGGMQYQKMQTPSTQMLNRGGDNVNRQFGNGPRGGSQQSAFRGGAVTGEILNANDTSLTVKLADGSSKIVLLTATTVINKASTGSKTDLTTGAKVAVFGTPNSDGSVTATNVQLNPTVGMAGMRGDGIPKNAGSKSTDATEIAISGKNYSYTPNAITIPVGQKTRIVFKSAEDMHDFVVDELKIRTAVIQSGDTDWVEFTPTAAGTYKFYCSVGSHRAMGMEGTLIVK